METHPMTRFITASAFAIALLGFAGCDDNSAAEGSGGDVEQSDAVPGSQTDVPAAEEPSPPVAPVE